MNAIMPLKNIRVLDLTRLLPGPYCTQLLADFGAEVIKVEEPELGDYARWGEPKIGEYKAIFSSINRNKKSITLNFKKSEDKESFIEIVKTSDVLVESFRPNVMERLGLDYETLKKVNPRLVYCAITGFGQNGPYKDKSGHDINYLSIAGLLQFSGEKGNKPIPPPTQIADIGGGSLMAAVGILTALLGRDQTGKGQFVDISMTDGVLSWMQTILPDYLAGLDKHKGELRLSGGKAAYSAYETADNRYLAVGALESKFWKEFCQGIERLDFIPLLEAPFEEQQKLKREIEQIIKKKTLDDWMEVFGLLDACVSPVLLLEETLNHPQIKARNMIIETQDNELGKLKYIGIPIKLSDTPGQIRSRAPKLGEHNEEILGKL
ncbi:CaiB/BaiF CoA transferase family protein [Oceanobacillus saliphilus]|uniref:CaiB/BaiF CoA transferase family protein n=1 Tax=Oceanobacillus saliphilus TaxID=2925834 RepID=UPI00201E59C8|nr:CaiB/BaiF CoA-transferase family protein [Oceanobacillus saliphilus]